MPFPFMRICSSLTRDPIPLSFQEYRITRRLLYICAFIIFRTFVSSSQPQLKSLLVNPASLPKENALLIQFEFSNAHIT